MHHVLTVAASDSCGGAGIQADIKTISALGAYALTVITGVTAQNTVDICGVQYMEAQVVRNQLAALFDDIQIDAIKIGVLGNKEITEVLAEFIRQKVKLVSPQIPIVLDPVLRASSGYMFAEEGLHKEIQAQLLPLITVFTPNLPEAEIFLGYPIKGIAAMEQACRDLLKMGPDWVAVKGGHLDGQPVDIIGNNHQTWTISGKRMKGSNDHGTGCAFSSALATFLAQGCSVLDAVQKAKAYIEEALVAGFRIGQGRGVLDHLYIVRNCGKEDRQS